MDNKKISGILFYIASFCFYIVAIINFFSHKDSSMGVIYLALGSCMMACGASMSNNIDKSDKDENDNNENTTDSDNYEDNENDK